MKIYKLSALIPIIPLVFMIQACSDQKERTTGEIRDHITDYQRQISDLTREITLMESELSARGETVENLSAVRIEVEKLTSGPFDHYFTINGSAEAIQEAMISPETNGQLKNIFVEKGERVEKGQIVGRLNTSVLENNIEELKTNINLAATVYERQKGLWDQKIGSEIQFLEAKNAFESLQARLRSLESQLDMAVLRAPFAGVIDDIFLKGGEMAMPGTPVMLIINLSRMYVNANLSETYLSMIDPRDMVILRFPAYPDFEARVPVHRIGNFINPENRTFRMQLRIDNPGERFKPNMVASFSIRSFSAENVIVIPSLLIKQDLQGHFVYVARETGNGTWKATRAYIERGQEGEGRTLVSSGLEEGEMIIVQGHNQLAEGVNVVFE